MPKRDPDQVFRGSFQEPPYFEDLTERCALKLTSLMRFTGRPHFTLWMDQIGGPRFREETGQYIPIFYLELEVLDVPVETRAPATVEVEVRLGRERVEEGAVPRLVSEGRTRVVVPTADGPRHVGSTRKLTIFAHLDPSRGRVTELHPFMEMGSHPRRVIEIPRLIDMLRPPSGFDGDGWTFEDSEPQVWSYQQTDPNRHIHAMEYPRMLDLFVTRERAKRGVEAGDAVLSRARIFFARPCYTGEHYVRRAKVWTPAADGGQIVCAALFKCDADGRVADEDRPANVCWFEPRSREAARAELAGFRESW
ncbi:MAG: hypothetical protein ACREQJ_02640 [Candidatus Binatia bacterium]